MSFDYSKLSDADLEALANNDYSKLSDEALSLIAQGERPVEEGTKGMSAIDAAAGVGQMAFEYGKPVAHFAKEVITNPVVDVIGAYKYGPKLLEKAGEYVARGVNKVTQTPDVWKTLGASEEENIAAQAARQAGQSAPKQPGMVARGMNMLGRAAGTVAELPGLVPAAAFSAPYLGTAMAQEEIRQNPNKPEYANNPYAMQQRGVAPTQGAAGAMNRRATVANQQYGGLTAQERAILEKDRLDQMIRAAAAKKALAFPGQ